MSLRFKVILGIAAALSGCAVVSPESKPHALFPAARYVKLPNIPVRYAEYIVDGVIEPRASLGNLPMAAGPLEVDCQSYEEIGMMVRPANWKGGGYHHMYSFSLSGTNIDARPLNYISYRKLMSGGFVRGVIRFRDQPENGIVTLTVAHRGEELLSTEFKFVNCY